MKGKGGSGKNTSDVAVADELDSWTKTKQLARPEDQVELNEQVELCFCCVKDYEIYVVWEGSVGIAANLWTG